MSRVCGECNTVLDDTAKFCFHCGALVSASADGQTMPLNNDGEEIDRLTDNDKATSVLTEETGKLRPEDMSGYVPLQPSFVPNVSAPDVYNEKEFYEGFVSKKAKGWTTAIGVIALISGAVNIPILFLGNLFAIIDIVFYVLMGILILTTKKWGLPLAVTMYSGVASVLSLATGGTPGGIMALVFGIFATSNLKKVSNAYRLYRQSGVLPQKPIE